jgi:hypothetical protein
VWHHPTDVWTKAKLSQPRKKPEAVCAGGKIVIAGGEIAKPPAPPPSSSSSSAASAAAAAASPSPWRHSAHLVGHRVGSRDYSDVVDVFDTATATWSTSRLGQARQCVCPIPPITSAFCHSCAQAWEKESISISLPKHQVLQTHSAMGAAVIRVHTHTHTHTHTERHTHHTLTTHTRSRARARAHTHTHTHTHTISSPPHFHSRRAHTEVPSSGHCLGVCVGISGQRERLRISRCTLVDSTMTFAWHQLKCSTASPGSGSTTPGLCHTTGECTLQPACNHSTTPSLFFLKDNSDLL